MLTLVPCSAHPPPLLLEHLLRSHLLLCSSCLRVLGMSTGCCLPCTVPSLFPRTGTHGTALTESHWGQGHLQSQHKKRAKEASTVCMLRGLSCAQAARPAQDTVVLPWGWGGKDWMFAQGLQHIYMALLPLDPPQHFPRGRKRLDQQLHIVAGLHLILSSKFRMKGQKLIESQKILRVQWNNCQYSFSATSSGLLDIGPPAFPCCFISDALCKPLKFLPVPALAPIQQVFSVGVGTSASVQ